MKLFYNHIGFETKDLKKAILYTDACDEKTEAYICNVDTRETYIATIQPPKQLNEWTDGWYYQIDFSFIEEKGRYQIKVSQNKEHMFSDTFEIRDYFYSLRLVNAQRAYLKSERSSGEWLKADCSVKFAGNKEGQMDLHGGWYDATGDFGIHMTQLSHTHVFNMMQSGLAAYACFEAARKTLEQGSKGARILRKELLDEGYWGADYIMRLHIPKGSFYRSVDRGEAFSEKQNRKIDFEYFKYSGHEADQSYLHEDIEDKHYQVGFRSGGGICIAVLANAAGENAASGEYKKEQYKEAAIEAFNYLLENNEKHISDGKWNFLDIYSALLAAVELYKNFKEICYLDICRKMFMNLQTYIVEMREGCWFYAKDKELYFHPSDEGAVLYALAKYWELETDKILCKQVAIIIENAWKHLTSISDYPFGYARFTYKKEEKEINRFFFPHDTKAAPWWQGENARIASLASAAHQCMDIIEDKNLKQKILEFSQNQLDWIMGCNPFDSCMIDGFGRNNIQYFFQNQYDFMNSPGGICNGITARESDDMGLEFVMDPTKDCNDNWRWAEQWLPHTAWFLIAMSMRLV